VTLATAKTDTIILQSNTAIQKGKYEQKGIVDGKNNYAVKGTYEAHWMYLRGEGWRLQRMDTKPTQ